MYNSNGIFLFLCFNSSLASGLWLKYTAGQSGVRFSAPFMVYTLIVVGLLCTNKWIIIIIII